MRSRWVCAGVAALVLAGCEPSQPAGSPGTRSPGPTPTAEDTRLVGLVASMSGAWSWRGENAFEGADVAVQRLNARSDDDVDYELVVRDDRGDPDAAVDHIERLASEERVAGVVYAGPPRALPRAEPALARAGIPAIAVFGDLYGAQRLTPHVFQASPSLVWESRRIASYFVRDRGYRRIGILPSTTDAPTAIEALRAAARPFGRVRVVDAVLRGRLPSREPTTAAIRLGLRDLRRKRVQAVVVEGPPTTFGRALAALRAMGARYRTTRVARRGARPGRPWKPQVAGFDTAISPRVTPAPPPGTIASDSYARGAHFLPVPSLAAFRRAFERWWESRPLGWEQRAHDAVAMIAWADRRGGDGDRAAALEGLSGARFAGLDVTLGPDDHTSVDDSAVGIWVVPRAGLRIAGGSRRPPDLPWVPLARGFSIDGEDTDVAARDWRYLFRKAPPPKAPPPPVRRMKFAVSTRARDPVH